MKQGLKLVGEELRQKRKEMNLSLKEIENATSIRTAHLNSIEEGDMDKLISPIYAQGFVRQYAIFLGMDGEAIIEKYPEVFSKKLEKQEFSYGIGTLEKRGNPGSGVRLFPNALWGVAFVLLAVVGWYVAKSLGVF